MKFKNLEEPNEFDTMQLRAQERLNERRWDLRFLYMAEEISSWSKDPSTKVGCVIVSPDRRRFALGYNGFPRGLDDLETLYADREVKLARTVHAELNAILNAPHSVSGHTLYCTLFPCSECCKAIIQAGISKIVTREPSPEHVERWKESFELTKLFLSESRVQAVLYPK